MKKIAIVLMMALLVLGCVFAETTSKNSTNNDKFIVKTTIGQIYPVYELVGKNDSSSSVTSATTVTSDQEIEGILSENGDSLSINVELNHYGMKNNNTDTNTKVDIRYKGAVTVKITAGKLENQSAETTGRVAESEFPTAGTFNGSTATNFKATVATANNEATITATYENGKKVATGANSVKIAEGEFTWDISGLTAGDTYKADVVVTYTIV